MRDRNKAARGWLSGQPEEVVSPVGTKEFFFLVRNGGIGLSERSVLAGAGAVEFVIAQTDLVLSEAES
jgi:hypothetical protein